MVTVQICGTKNRDGERWMKEEIVGILVESCIFVESPMPAS